MKMVCIEGPICVHMLSFPAFPFRFASYIKYDFYALFNSTTEVKPFVKKQRIFVESSSEMSQLNVGFLYLYET